MRFFTDLAASMPWLKTVFLGNTVQAYLLCLATILVGIFLVWLLDKTVVRALERLTRHTDSTFDDFVIQTGEKFALPALYALVTYVGLRDLAMTPALGKWLKAAVMVTVAVQIVRLLMRLLQEVLERHMARRAGSVELVDAERKSVRGILVFVSIVTWVLASILVLDNLGVKVSTFVAGLGIGGIAIALAAQAVLGDLFSYFVIFFDRPFQVGHAIKVGNFQGEVESIGIKTTRIRSLTGEIIVMSNKYLTDNQVQNYRMLQRRRALVTFDVEYATPNEKLRDIPVMIKDIAAAIPHTTLERSHLHSFQESGLRFETVFFVEVPEYGTYMDVLQEFNLKLKEGLEARGIGVALPTRVMRTFAAPEMPEAPEAPAAAAPGAVSRDS
jgi:small-conductance mechanosensitive channel